MLDIGKLIFASVFLGNILRGEIVYTIMAISGLLVAIVFCFIGILLVTKEMKNGNEVGDNPPAKKE